MARPSKYKEEFCEQAEQLCVLGATDSQLAKFFKVRESTLNNWKKSHPEFLESLKGAKAISDELVVRSLFERATGYSHPDTHISNYLGKITCTPITKHYPPDPTSCIFWLKNRDKDNWRDKPDEWQGSDETPTPQEYL